MLNIRILTIPHSEQAYDTVGNYWVDKDGVMQFRVSDLGNPWKELGVIIHELIESYLLLLRGVPWDSIDKFDIAYENARASGKAPCGCKPFEEPGDDPHAPYRKEHRFSENIERQFIHEAGVDWKEYSDQVEAL